MIVVAKAKKGAEFWYSPASAHRVAEKNADKICAELNMEKYGLKDGQVWHKFEVGMFDNAHAYGEMQGFQLRKDGTIRKVGKKR